MVEIKYYKLLKKATRNIVRVKSDSGGICSATKVRPSSRNGLWWAEFVLLNKIFYRKLVIYDNDRMERTCSLIKRAIGAIKMSRTCSTVQCTYA